MKYFCTNCNAEYLKWSGRCSACGEWDSLQEAVEDSKAEGKSKKKEYVGKAYKFNEISRKSNAPSARLLSGFTEFDRVLGGGIVPGSITLIAGEPGIGKSTLLSQIAVNLSQTKKVLYISGEESASQIYSRIKRISKANSYSNLLVSEDVVVEAIDALVEAEMPDLVIVDSVQSLSSETVRSYAGSIGQVRVCGAKLTRIAKFYNAAVFVIGQITKEGSVAGPKVLEHIVDSVMFFEGGEYSQFRILRAGKNRFGATDEIGVFEMSSEGMVQVENPSQAFLDDENWGEGTAIGSILKGSRVVFVEVQALVVDRGSEFGPLRRVANGVRKQRLDMLCAVLSRRGGVYLGDKDVFVNVVGGVEVGDPSLDLALCMAIKSASRDETLSSKSVYFGEVGLTGEIRRGGTYKTVAKEAKRLGYKLVSGMSGSTNIKQL
ncbi:DNA repair protein RadA [bacterium]|nr:DNA repair protein RadA [bacterium]